MCCLQLRRKYFSETLSPKSDGHLFATLNYNTYYNTERRCCKGGCIACSALSISSVRSKYMYSVSISVSITEVLCVV